MRTRSMAKILEDNQYQNKRKNNEIKNTVRKKLKMNAENKSADCTNLERKENRRSVHVSETVPSEYGESSSNTVVKQRNTKSHEKKSTQSFRVQQSTSQSFNQQLQVNIPSLPVNLFTSPGCSNYTNYMTNLCTQNCISNQPSLVRNNILPYKMQNMPVLPIHFVQTVSSQMMPAIHSDSLVQRSEIINFSNTMYNEDMVTVNKQIECIICLENMDRGQKIARLQCLCIYHKSCIDLWFNKKICCPVHPPL